MKLAVGRMICLGEQRHSKGAEADTEGNLARRESEGERDGVCDSDLALFVLYLHH